MGTRDQTKLKYTLIGSVAERVLKEVDTDIIAVPLNNQKHGISTANKLRK